MIGSKEIRLLFGMSIILITKQVYFSILLVDKTPPVISNLTIENKTYTAEIPLNFSLNEIASQISYSLDNQANVTILGNTTLAGLSDVT